MKSLFTPTSGSTIFLLFTFFFSQAQLVTSPLAHYMFDETSGKVVADSSGNAITASISGTEAWVDGYLGGALEFDGTTIVDLPIDAIDLTSDIGSVSAWVYAEDTGIRTIWAGGDNDTGGGFGPENEMHLILEPYEEDIWEGGELTFYGHSSEAGKLFFIWSDEDKGMTDPLATPVNPISLDDDAWHHVVSTWGENIARIYIDGERVAELEYTAPSTPYKYTHFRIGAMLQGNRTFIGKIDDMRIYDGILTVEEIDQLYKNEIVVVPEFVLASNISETFSLFPNPANESTTLRLNSEIIESDYSIEIYSLDGKLFPLTVATKETELILDISSLEAGLYILRLSSGDTFKQFKFLKQ